MRKLRGEVDVVRARVERVEVLGEALPPPRETLVERRTRNVLDALHELDQTAVVLGMHGCEAHTTVAHDDGGDAVPRRRQETLVPCGLAVVVGVDVDEARGYESAVGVDDARRGVVDASHRGDDPVEHRDVGRSPRRPGAVEHLATLDHEIEDTHDATPTFRIGSLML